MVKNPRAVSAGIGLWLALYAGWAYAAASSSLWQDALDFDWRSVLIAMGAGLLGGLLRTILVLAGGKKVLLDVLKEARADLAIAGVGGIIVYIIIQGLASLGWFTVPRDLRVLMIGGAGFSRGAWLKFVERKSAETAEAAGDWFSRQIGGDKKIDPPPSAVTPLEETK